jgi:TolB protein
MSLTADAQTLVTVQNEARVNVWTVPGGDVNRARQSTTGIGQYDGARGISWTPDGRIVYVSRLSGSQDIWIMDADGTRQQQLTNAATRADVYPSASSDGRYIVFSSNRAGNSNIWRMNPDGSNPVQLTNGKGEEFPYCSPDGKWVVYTSTATSKFTIWKVPIDGGEPQQLTDQLSQWPVVSPDSKLVSCWYRGEPNSPWRIAIIPIEGGETIKMLDVPSTVTQAIPFRWSADGRAISYIDTRDGVSNIWSQALSGGRAVQLTDFKSDQMFWFDWSMDGRLLAVARGHVTNDVVTISDFQ